MPTAQLYPTTGSDKPTNRVERRPGAPGAPESPRLGTKASNDVAGPPQDLTRRLERRDTKYATRARQRSFTSIPRVAHCGFSMNANTTGVALKIAGGVAYFAGVQTCGSVAACAVCGPKIRQHRAAGADEAFKVATERGHGVLLMTPTCRHDRGMPLLDLRKRKEAAFRRFRQGRPWRALMAGEIVGWMNQREITYGEAFGWHPHSHLGIVTATPKDDDQVEQLRAGLYPSWATSLAAEGLTAEETVRMADGQIKHPGLDVRHGDAAVGDYMLKVRGHDQDLAMELMRGDLKEGRRGSRTPEQIRSDFIEYGEVRDRGLWREYEQATAGARMTTGLTALRRKLGLGDVELTDEEIVELRIDGECLAVLSPASWAAVRCASPGGSALLRAAEAGRHVEYLTELLGTSGWMRGATDG